MNLTEEQNSEIMALDHREGVLLAKLRVTTGQLSFLRGHRDLGTHMTARLETSGLRLPLKVRLTVAPIQAA